MINNPYTFMKRFNPNGIDFDDALPQKDEKGQDTFMAMKLDTYKAHDRIESPFVTKILFVLGFPKKWTHLIMECITMVTDSILINRPGEGRFKLS